MGDGMLSRDELLKRAAVLGGAGLAAGLGAGRVSAAIDAADAESGRLQVLDWVGYEVKQLWAPYAAKYPGDPPQFEDRTTNESTPPVATSADTLTSFATVFRIRVRPFSRGLASSRFLEHSRRPRNGSRRIARRWYLSRSRRRPTAPPPG